MSKFFKLSVLVSILAIAFAFAISPSPAQASDNFNLYMKHNINGQSLGLARRYQLTYTLMAGMRLPSVSAKASRPHSQLATISSRSNWPGRTQPL